MNRRNMLAGAAALLGAAGARAAAIAQTTPPGAEPALLPAQARDPEPGFEGRHLIVDALELQDVRHVFGVPGAGIDPIVDAMIGRKVQMVHAGQEAHAAFMAGAVGRITGRPGVCMAASGPGAAGLAAGVVCATAEGNPVVAITGGPARDRRHRIGAQNIASSAIFAPVTKSSVTVEAPQALTSAIANAFRNAAFPRQGAAHVEVPLGVTTGPADQGTAFALPDPAQGTAPQPALEAAARLLRAARTPIVLVGGAGASLLAAKALRSFLARTPLPVVEVSDAAGSLSRTLANCFVGRVGDHSDQPGDALLRRADLVLAVGFDVSEYDPAQWRNAASGRVLHIGDHPAAATPEYRPELTLLGDIAANLEALQKAAGTKLEVDWVAVRAAQTQLAAFLTAQAPLTGPGVSPVAFVRALRDLLADDVTVVADVGSAERWMVRNFISYEPRRLLVGSKGWGALGTGLPKAIGAAFARPGEKVVCNTGDGSFLMGGMEMQTAARLKLPIVQIIWQDGTYDLTRIAAERHFGRWDGFAFRTMDIEAFAAAFGAKGLRIERDEQIRPVLRQALDADGPVMVDLRVDYSANARLMEKPLRAEAG